MKHIKDNMKYLKRFKIFESSSTFNDVHECFLPVKDLIEIYYEDRIIQGEPSILLIIKNIDKASNKTEIAEEITNSLSHCFGMKLKLDKGSIAWKITEEDLKYDEVNNVYKWNCDPFKINLKKTSTAENIYILTSFNGRDWYMSLFNEKLKPSYANNLIKKDYAKISLNIPPISENENEILDFIEHKAKDLKEIILVFGKR